MPTFLPGLELSRRFYAEAVAPLLPDVPHAAALVGPGSEVLGFDTERSTDHAWGPRLQLFVEDNRGAEEIDETLRTNLPHTFAGYPTSFTRPSPEDSDVPAPRTEGPVDHRVTVTDLGTWFTTRLGFDPRAGVSLHDWLATPTQLLAEATGGAVFADGPGELTAARAALAWYPPDVWRYVLACQWQRVSQEEPFVGRTGEVGDDTGSAVLAARLVRDLMRLCLLAARRWPPYGKWLGSAYARLPDGAPDLATVLAARTWPEREAALVRATTAAARMTNALGLAEPVDPAPRGFHDRPFRVLRADRFTQALRTAITDPGIRALPAVGAVDQFVDSTDVLSHPGRARAAALAVLR